MQFLSKLIFVQNNYHCLWQSTGEKAYFFLLMLGFCVYGYLYVFVPGHNIDMCVHTCVLVYLPVHEYVAVRWGPYVCSSNMLCFIIFIENCFSVNLRVVSHVSTLGNRAYLCSCQCTWKQGWSPLHSGQTNTFTTEPTAWFSYLFKHNNTSCYY